MRASEFLTESVPRTLYHGTLKSNIPSIEQNYLTPAVGNFTSHFYGDEEGDELPELVFAASKHDLQKCLNSIVHYLKKENIPSTPANVIKYGAIIVIKDVNNVFKQRLYDPDEDEYAYDHPSTVEPGDFYSDDHIKPTLIIKDAKLKNLLRRNGFDAWMGSKHPKLVRK